MGRDKVANERKVGEEVLIEKKIEQTLIQEYQPRLPYPAKVKKDKMDDQF